MALKEKIETPENPKVNGANEWQVNIPWVNAPEVKAAEIPEDTPETIPEVTPEIVAPKPMIKTDLRKDKLVRTNLETWVVSEKLDNWMIKSDLSQAAPKIETAEDVKIKQLDIKDKELTQAQVQAEKEQLANQELVKSFDVAMRAWNLEQANELVIANPNLKQTFANTAKVYLGNKNNAKYVSKYTNMSSAEMLQQEVKWEFIKWDMQYSLLSPEKRAEYEAYRTKNIWLIIKDTEKSQQYVDNITNNANQEEKPTLVSVDLRTRISDMYKDPAYIAKREELQAKWAEISDLNTRIMWVKEDIEKSLKKRWIKLVWSELSNYISDRTRDLNIEKVALSWEFSAINSVFSDMKNDINQEIELVKYEDAINQKQYQMDLAQYNTDRARMDKFELLAFEEKSQILAEERQKDWQLKLLENERKYEAQNKKGVYQTDRDWNLLYIVDWVAEQVKQNDWSVVWMTRTEDYTDVVNKMADWWFEILRTYTDWKTEYMTRWVNWKDIYNSSLWAKNIISSIPNKDLWCWEFTNQYWANWWLVSTTTWKKVHVWDTYKSKKAAINSQTPQVWWLAVWNPNPQGKFWEYWHIWIVTGFNENEWTIEITDSNSQGNKKRRTYTIPVEQVLNSDGWFVEMKKPWVATTQQTYSNEAENWAKNIMSWADWFKITAIQDEALRTEVSSYMAENPLELEADNPIILALKEKMDIAQWLSENESLAKSVSGRVWRRWPIDFLTENKDAYLSKIQFLLDEQPLDKLINVKAQGATFWALSWPELSLLQKSSSLLNSAAERDANDKIIWFNLNEDEFIENIKILEDNYRKAIGEKIGIEQVDLLDRVKTWVWQTNDAQYFTNFEG